MAVVIFLAALVSSHVRRRDYVSAVQKSQECRKIFVNVTLRRFGLTIVTVEKQ